MAETRQDRIDKRFQLLSELKLILRAGMTVEDYIKHVEEELEGLKALSNKTHQD